MRPLRGATGVAVGEAAMVGEGELEVSEPPMLVDGREQVSG